MNAVGNEAMPNALNGILMNSSSSGTSIVDNVVSGNTADGVFVHSQATLLGNRIGIAATSEKAIPNHGDGVRLNGDGSDVGADGAGSANTIANNGGDGVFVSGGPTNEIVANSIYSNGGLGIDLGPTNGVTPNDVEDGDSGPNDLQNFPVFESVTFATGSTDHLHIVASAPTSPGAGSYRIDYYASDVCDPSGNGEGVRHLGHDLTGSGGGTISFDSDSVGPVLAGEILTATLTSPIGSTSEFSACHEIGGAGNELLFTTPADCVPGALGGHTINFEDAPSSGSLAAFYAPLGVQFVDDAETTPIASRNADRATSSPTASLFNKPDGIEAGSDGVPLTMHFDEPQTRVGFFAGNGAAGVTAQLTAYTGEELLGSVRVGNPGCAVSTYIGLRLSEGAFTTLTLDYGGSVRAEEIDDLCFLTSHEEGGGESTAISLTTDQANVVAGVKLVPLGDVPSNQLPCSPAHLPRRPSARSRWFDPGRLDPGGLDSGRFDPGRLDPSGLDPGRFDPSGLDPGRLDRPSSIPVGSIGLDQILLSMLPVNADELLAGTPLFTRPRQSITLGDVYANATTRARFNALNLPESGLMNSILNGVPFSAFMLGRATLAQLPAPGGASTWCAAITAAGGSCSGVSGTNTVVGLSIAGRSGRLDPGGLDPGRARFPSARSRSARSPWAASTSSRAGSPGSRSAASPRRRGARSSTHPSPTAGRSGTQRQRGGSSRERS